MSTLIEQELPVRADIPDLDAIAREFAEWKDQPGARHVLGHIYRICYPKAKRYLRTGQRCSVKLLWELTRDHITEIRARMKRRGYDLEKWEAYRLNNNFTALVARHILEHRPEWGNLFEIRQRGDS